MKERTLLRRLEAFATLVSVSKTRALVINLVAAVLLPFILELCFIVPALAMPVVLPWSDNFGSEMFLTAVGMVFVMRQFRWWAALIAIVYVPGMFASLVYFAVITNCVFGNCL